MIRTKKKPDIHKAWKDKMKEKFDQRKRGFKPFHFQNQERKPSQAGTKPARAMEDRTRDPKEIREPLQCWGWGGNHVRRNCLHENGYVRQAHNIQGAETVGQVARIALRIYAALEDCQDDH